MKRILASVFTQSMVASGDTDGGTFAFLAAESTGVLSLPVISAPMKTTISILMVHLLQAMSLPNAQDVIKG